jgi:hypothetical protein
MKAKATFHVAAPYVVLLDAIGRRTMSTHDIHDEIGPTIEHTNVSTVITRAVNRGWLAVVGREKQPRGGAALRVLKVTKLGHALRNYAAVERGEA